MGAKAIELGSWDMFCLFDFYSQLTNTIFSYIHYSTLTEGKTDLNASHYKANRSSTWVGILSEHDFLSFYFFSR